LCVPSISDLSERVQSLESRLVWSLATRRAHTETALLSASRRLVAACPVPTVRKRRIDIETTANRMHRAATHRIARSRQRVAVLSAVLVALDPAAVLQRGYAALQRADDGLPVFSVSQAEPGTRIVAHLADGALQSSVEATLSRSPNAVVTR
jgi:exodeoxyribonuclease VII large subunit